MPNLRSIFKISYRSKGRATWRNVETQELFNIPLDQSNRIRTNIERYTSIEQLENALFYQTNIGKMTSNIQAVNNFGKALYRLNVDESEYNALMRAFNSMSEAEKDKFWKINENFLTNVYNYYSDYIDDPFTARYGMRPEAPKDGSVIETAWGNGRQTGQMIESRLWEAFAQFGRYRDDFI